MPETQFIVAGGLIDGSGGEVRRQVFLAVRDGMITAIGPVADLSRQADAAITDLSHCNLLPPLVDCSVALCRSPSVDWRVRLAAEEAGPEAKAVRLARHIGYCHAYGVLGVLAEDDLSGLPPGRQKGLGQGGVIELRTAGGPWRSRQDGAAGRPPGDFLKIDYSGAIEEQEAPHLRLEPADLHRLLESRGGRKAVVVANGPQAVADALAAGCDAIEQGYGMGEANLRGMAERGVLWIPSVVRAKNGLDGSASGGEVCCRFSQRYVAPGKPQPGAEAFWKKTLADQVSQLRLARELGVVTALGTGAGSAGLLHGESLVEEMKLFIKAGYSLAETIRCASDTGARFFGLEGLGALTAGRPATFLIARGSVQQLPRKLAYLEGIYVHGAPSPFYRKNPVRAA